MLKRTASVFLLLCAGLLFVGRSADAQPTPLSLLFVQPTDVDPTTVTMTQQGVPVITGRQGEIYVPLTGGTLTTGGVDLHGAIRATPTDPTVLKDVLSVQLDFFYGGTLDTITVGTETAYPVGMTPSPWRVASKTRDSTVTDLFHVIFTADEGSIPINDNLLLTYQNDFGRFTTTSHAFVSASGGDQLFTSGAISFTAEETGKSRGPATVPEATTLIQVAFGGMSFLLIGRHYRRRRS